MVKLFTHTDLDGIGCEILAKIAFGKDVDVTNSEVSDINKNIKEFLDNPKNNGIYDKIYITIFLLIRKMLKGFQTGQKKCSY